MCTFSVRKRKERRKIKTIVSKKPTIIHRHITPQKERGHYSASNNTT